LSQMVRAYGLSGPELAIMISSSTTNLIRLQPQRSAFPEDVNDSRIHKPSLQALNQQVSPAAGRDGTNGRLVFCARHPRCDGGSSSSTTVYNAADLARCTVAISVSCADISKCASVLNSMAHRTGVPSVETPHPYTTAWCHPATRRICAFTPTHQPRPAPL
jgi:hypothetical protein